MPAHEPNPLREARVGLVTTCLVLGVSAVLIVLCNITWGARNTYRVGFRVNQDASGIEPGTPVTLGGITWGQVVSVMPGTIAADGRVLAPQGPFPPGTTRGTLVEFTLDARIQLHDGAKVGRSATILGGNVQLVVMETGLLHGAAGGLPMKTRGTLGEGAVVLASEAGGGLSSLVGPRLATRISTLPDDFSALAKDWNETIRPGLREGMDALRANTEPLFSSMRAETPGWRASLDRASEAGDRLRARLDPEGPDARSVVADVRRGWNEGARDFDAVKDDFDALKSRLEDDMGPRAERLADEATAEWKRLRTVFDRSRKAGSDTTETWGDAMADFSLMGGQIRIALDDLPYALLNTLLGKPGESGLARMRRLEAASRLALATADIRHANDALEAIASARQPADAAAAERLRASAAKAVAGFRSAVEALLQGASQP